MGQTGFMPTHPSPLGACALLALVSGAVLPGAAVHAEEDVQLPRTIILQGERTLPGDNGGSSFGVKVNRGPGFVAAPSPEPQSEDSEGYVDPTELPPLIIVPRQSRRGY